MTFSEEEKRVIVGCLKENLPLIHLDLARRVEAALGGNDEKKE